MGKSAELYTLCDVCEGEGVSPHAVLNRDGVCIVCNGKKYLPLGLNKAQVDTLYARVAELEAENTYQIAKIAELNERLTAYRQGVLMTTDESPEIRKACAAALWRLEQYNYDAMQPTIEKLRAALHISPEDGD